MLCVEPAIALFNAGEKLSLFQVPVGFKQLTCQWQGYFNFGGAHYTRSNLVRIEEKNYISFANPEVVIQRESVTRKAVALFGKALR